MQAKSECLVPSPLFRIHIVILRVDTIEKIRTIVKIQAIQTIRIKASWITRASSTTKATSSRQKPDIQPTITAWIQLWMADATNCSARRAASLLEAWTSFEGWSGSPTKRSLPASDAYHSQTLSRWTQWIGEQAGAHKTHLVLALMAVRCQKDLLCRRLFHQRMSKPKIWLLSTRHTQSNIPEHYIRLPAFYHKTRQSSQPQWTAQYYSSTISHHSASRLINHTLEGPSWPVCLKILLENK